jgi:hypothetical protein
MPVPLPNELRRLAGKSQNDLLELGVFGLPDLKAVPEEALDFPLPMGWKTYPNFVGLGCYIPLAERLLLCLFRSDRITNHKSLLTNQPSRRA